MVCSVLLYDTGIRSKIAILYLSISEPPQYGFRRILVETKEFSTQTQNLQITHSKAISTWYESFFNNQKQFHQDLRNGIFDWDSADIAL